MRTLFSCILVSVFLLSCQPNWQAAEPQPDKNLSTNARQAADIGSLVEVTYRGQKIRVVKKNGLYYFSRDLIIPNALVSAETPVRIPRLLQQTGVYRKLSVLPWPGNVVNFTMTGGGGLLSLGPKVQQAVNAWNAANTGIKFQHYKDAYPTAVSPPTTGILLFDLSPVNTANATWGVGFPGEGVENLKVTLMQDVTIDTILHEMMHVVGIIHEHQRGIRDQYVTINPYAASTYITNMTDLITQILDTEDITIYNDTVVDTYPFDYQSITIYDLPGLITSLNMTQPIKPGSTLTAKDTKLVRTISNHNTVPQLKIRNIDYPLGSIPVVLKGGNKSYFSLQPGRELALTYNAIKKCYTLNGAEVDYVDLNDGSYSDDIRFTFPGRIVYKPNFVSEQWLVTNYTNPSPFYQQTTEILDSDGIAGKGSVVIKAYSVSPDETNGFLTYITINKK